MLLEIGNTEKEHLFLFGATPLDSALLLRRETLLKTYIVKGVSVINAASEMTKSISDPYERQKQMNTICRDWGNRKRWLEEVVRISDSTFLSELIAGMDEAMMRCWIEYAEGDNTSARVGALRTIIIGKSRVGLLLMKAGKIATAVQQIESTMTIAGTPFDCDPELRKALLDESARQGLEKERQDAKSSS